MKLRRLTRLDLLTAREREVASALSEGKSHKEVAGMLGLALATQRNQTQSNKGEVRIDNRAALCPMLTQNA